jgi:hypothetical protein
VAKKYKDKNRAKAKMRQSRPAPVRSGAGIILQHQNKKTIETTPSVYSQFFNQAFGIPEELINDTLAMFTGNDEVLTFKNGSTITAVPADEGTIRGCSSNDITWISQFENEEEN